VQRCTVHKHRNLLAHAPDRLHEEISAEYAGTPKEIVQQDHAAIQHIESGE